MRSVFASCYNSMVGLRHIGERGFVQEKRYSRTTSESDFVRAFFSDTSLCDTVIVTSSGLFELDAGLCPRASTEDLVGEQVRRLSYAVMEPRILGRIVGPRSANSKPCYFALGSATVNPPSPLSGLQSILCRQSAFISASFGPLAGLPIIILTATEHGPDLLMPTEIIDVFSRIHGHPIEPIAIDEVQAPYYQADARDWPGALDMIALWPFKLDDN